MAKKGTKCYWERQGNKSIQKHTLLLPILSVSGWRVTECSSMIQYGKIFSPIVLSIHVMLPIFFACYASYAQCTEYIIKYSYQCLNVCRCLCHTFYMFSLCAIFAFSGFVSKVLCMCNVGEATGQTIHDLKYTVKMPLGE